MNFKLKFGIAINDEIETIMDKYKPHVLGISEAIFKKEHDFDDLVIENYETIL